MSPSCDFSASQQICTLLQEVALHTEETNESTLPELATQIELRGDVASSGRSAAGSTTMQCSPHTATTRLCRQLIHALLSNCIITLSQAAAAVA